MQTYAYLRNYCRIDWYIKHPLKEFKSIFYLDPFRRNFRMAVIGAFLIGTACVLAMRYFAQTKNNRSLTDDMFLVFEHFCNQDGSNELQSISIRIASLCLRFISIIVISSFGAVATSYFAIRPMEIPFVDRESFFVNEQYSMLLDPPTLSLFVSLILNYVGSYVG